MTKSKNVGAAAAISAKAGSAKPVKAAKAKPLASRAISNMPTAHEKQGVHVLATHAGGTITLSQAELTRIVSEAARTGMQQAQAVGLKINGSYESFSVAAHQELADSSPIPAHGRSLGSNVKETAKGVSALDAALGELNDMMSIQLDTIRMLENKLDPIMYGQSLEEDTTKESGISSSGLIASIENMTARARSNRAYIQSLVDRLPT
jgi:hypothetical protein